MVKGKTIEEALKIKKDDIVEELGGLLLTRFIVQCLGLMP